MRDFIILILRVCGIVVGLYFIVRGVYGPA